MMDSEDDDFDGESVDDNFSLSTSDESQSSPRPPPPPPLPAAPAPAALTASLSSDAVGATRAVIKPSTSADQVTLVHASAVRRQSRLSPRERGERTRRSLKDVHGKHNSESFATPTKAKSAIVSPTFSSSAGATIERSNTSEQLHRSASSSSSSSSSSINSTSSSSSSASTTSKSPRRSGSQLFRFAKQVEKTDKRTDGSPAGAVFSSPPSSSPPPATPQPLSTSLQWTLGRTGLSQFDSLTVYRKDLDYVAEETAPLLTPDVSGFYVENGVNTHTPTLWRKVSGFDWFRKHFQGRKYRFFIGSHEFIGVVLVIFIKDDAGLIRSMFFTESGVEAKAFSPAQLSKLGISSLQLTKSQKRKWEAKFLGRINGALVSPQCTLTRGVAFPLLEQRLAELETFQGYTLNRTTTRFKIGVVYYDDSVDDEAALFLADPSDDRDYAEFLHYLGTALPIQSAASSALYTGNLTTQNCDQFLHYQDVDAPVPEIAFHVNSWLKDPLAQTPEDRILAAKRHIANDSVVIVYKTPGSKPFDPTLIRSQYTQVYFVVEKQSPHSWQRSHDVAFPLKVAPVAAAAAAAAATATASDAITSSVSSPLLPTIVVDPPAGDCSPPATPLPAGDTHSKQDSTERSVHFVTAAASSSSCGDGGAADDITVSDAAAAPASGGEQTAFAALSWDSVATKKQVKIFRVFLDAKRFKTVALHLPASFGELRVAVHHKCKGLGLDTSKFVLCALHHGQEIEPHSGFYSSWDIFALIGHWPDRDYQLMFRPASRPPDADFKATLDRMTKSGHYSPAGIAQMYSTHSPSQQTRYRLTITTKEGVSPWSPPFPPVTWFPADLRFKKFLVEKLVAAQLACHLSPQWTQRFARSRKILLEELSQASLIKS